MNLDSTLYHTQKLRWIIDQNIKAKTTKLLEENMRKSSQSWVKQEFLRVQKAPIIKERK